MIHPIQNHRQLKSRTAHFRRWRDRLACLFTGTGLHASGQPRTIFTEDRVRKVLLRTHGRSVKKLKTAWQEFAGNIGSCPDDFKGRGIVICAGGITYFTCAWINIHLLRKHKCQLPVELWYTGHELTAEIIDIISALGVVCKRAEDYDPAEVRGFALKPFAILHSAFREVLYLDADNNSMRDPGYLFDDDKFRKKGAVFWPDFWMTAPDNPIWKIIGSDNYNSPEQESGQILIDKVKCWKELNLCMYFNRQRKFYYKMLLGDKDTFRFAWMALGSSYHMVEKEVGLAGYENRSGRFCGMSMVQHDMQGQVVFIHRNLLKWDITLDGELSWKIIMRFRKGAQNKRISTHYIAAKEGRGLLVSELKGEVEKTCFGDQFGDLERDCLEALHALRDQDFYGRFLLHFYFTHYRPGYNEHYLNQYKNLTYEK